MYAHTTHDHAFAHAGSCSNLVVAKAKDLTRCLANFSLGLEEATFVAGPVSARGLVLMCSRTCSYALRSTLTCMSSARKHTLACTQLWT